MWYATGFIMSDFIRRLLDRDIYYFMTFVKNEINVIRF